MWCAQVQQSTHMPQRLSLRAFGGAVIVLDIDEEHSCLAGDHRPLPELRLWLIESLGMLCCGLGAAEVCLYALAR